jgi:hypothetical protein
MREINGSRFAKKIFDGYKQYNKLWQENRKRRKSPVASGQYTEELIREHLNCYVPDEKKEKIRLISGMIYNNKTPSPQVDIIICNPSPEDSILKVNGFVNIKRTYGIIEVKTLLQDRNAIDKGRNQIRKIRDLVKDENLPAGILWVYLCLQDEEAVKHEIKECEKAKITLGVIGKKISMEESNAIPEEDRYRYSSQEMRPNYTDWQLNFENSAGNFLDWFIRVCSRNIV